MKEQLIECNDTIWRFLVNPTDHRLFLECKTENNQFYLWDPKSNKRWNFPELEKHASTILQVQYPYALISYYPTEHLLNASLLMCYSLELNKELWASSEIKLEECFLGELMVYPVKISPKRYEFINFNKENIQQAQKTGIQLDIQHAEKQASTHVLEHHSDLWEIEYSDDTYELTIQYKENGKATWQKSMAMDDFRTEYDYLLRIGHSIFILLDKQRILILNK